MRKKLFVILALLTFLFAGCSNIGSYQKSIYDDDSKILKQGDSYTFISRTGNTYGNTISLSFGGFSGKQTIWKVTAEEDSSVDVKLDVKIAGGKFKICLINSNNEVSIISEGTQNEDITFDVPKGKNYIAIVGSDAKGEVAMTLEDNEKMSITPEE